ncbi:MAG: T9SS type A sorting domain-containing protein [Parcubacteria group bacterium]|nr:T9SS type A sorting domain-containing protein [Parcubacteria group bacterium]
MKKLSLWLLVAIVVLGFAVPTAFAQDVAGIIVASDGTGTDVDIATMEEEDTHWFSVQIENSTAAIVTVNSVDIVLTWETEDITVLEVEKDNTAFSASTFSWSIDPVGLAGLYTVTISMADVTGIALADGSLIPTSLIAAWVRIDPSAMHVDTLYDIGLYTETFDSVTGDKYKRNDTAQIYCDTDKGDNSFGGPTAAPVTAFDVLMVVQQSSGVADYVGTSQLKSDVMDVDADGEITAEDVYYTLEKAADDTYVYPADSAGHHPAPPANSAKANPAFMRTIQGNPSAKCVFRLTPLEFISPDHYRTFLVAEGVPQKPVGIDVDFNKTPNLEVEILPTEYLSAAEEKTAVKPATARLVFAQMSPLEDSGVIAEINLTTENGRLPEFSIQYVYINEGRPTEPGEPKNLVRWERQAIMTPVTKLFQNYPNPFNPETWIPYQLSVPSAVAIRIFSAGGRMVRQIHLGIREPGFYVSKSQAAYWDGRNASGETVASGVYFYNIQAGDAVSTRKMVVVR